ncbi:MAG: polymer-forming cytoskeletal protein [Acidobacteriota bacterium]
MTDRPQTERRLSGWLGSALTIEGRIVSSENLTIDGSVEGSIEVGAHNLTIGEMARVRADLVAETVTISGTVVGNVRGSVRIELQPTAVVTGDVTAPLLVMADGAAVTGRVDVAGRPRGKG